MEDPVSEQYGLQYCPHVQLQDDEVLNFLHRLDALRAPEGRGRNNKKPNVEKYLENNRAFYDKDLPCSFLCRPRADSLQAFRPTTLAISRFNNMLLYQKKLKDEREAAKKRGDALRQEEDRTEDETDESYVSSTRVAKPMALLWPDGTGTHKALETPAEMSRRLACESGAAADKQQYEMIILCTAPLQQLWDFAQNTNRLHDFCSNPGLHICVALVLFRSWQV